MPHTPNGEVFTTTPLERMDQLPKKKNKRREMCDGAKPSGPTRFTPKKRLPPKNDFAVCCCSMPTLRYYTFLWCELLLLAYLVSSFAFCHFASCQFAVAFPSRGFALEFDFVSILFVFCQSTLSRLNHDEVRQPVFYLSFFISAIV